MFLFLKRYFVAVFVIDAKRLSLFAHTFDSGRQRSIFKKKKNQLLRHVFGAVIYLHLFAFALCTNQISSLPQWSLAQEGEAKASQALRWPVQRHAQRWFQQGCAAGCCFGMGERKAFGRRRGERATFPAGACSNAAWPGA